MQPAAGSAVSFDATIQAALMDGARRGDAAAVGELYDTTFPRVYSFAYSLAGNRCDAEDITSETYERALRGIKRYESRDVPVVVWLVRIARNVAHELHRANERAQVVELTDAMVEALPGRDWPEGETFATFEFDMLTAAQREVIALRLAGFKVREIASTLGKAEGTVKALQFAAVRRLRKAAQP